MEKEEPPIEEKAETGATLLFLVFILIIGYILQGYWIGLYPFTTNSTGQVYLAAPIVLIILASLALSSLVGGMIRAHYPRVGVILAVIIGLVILVIISYIILSKPVNPFQPYM
jgi:dolichyl-phosphate-mannose--protein O-mannosyl transferase